MGTAHATARRRLSAGLLAVTAAIFWVRSIVAAPLG